MAVFQGVRVRTVPLPGPTSPARRRADVTSARLSAGRVRPVGLLLATILTATMLGLVYLTQTLASNAANAELGGLGGAGVTLDQTLQRQSWAVEEAMAPSALVRRAHDLGLVKLDDGVVLSVP